MHIYDLYDIQIYISGPWVGITHECYFMVVDLDLLTCDIGDASATCSWASSPLGMIMALTEHRFHPFSLTFSATWLSPSSHRVTAKSYSVGLCRHHSLGTGTQPSVLHRSAQNGTGARKEMCRCSCPAMPEIQIVAKPCPEAEQDPCQLGIFFIVKPSFLLYDGNWHCLTWSMAPLFAPFSQPLVRLKHFLAFPLVLCECCGTQSHPE